MKIGFIGAGQVAQRYAHHFSQNGHEVMLSNTRGPESLKEHVRNLGSNVKAGSVSEAASQELVILAVRWEHAKQALAEVADWKGRVLVDATNRPADAETHGKTASELIASYAPGARLVKALNTLVINWMPDPSENTDKLVLFISGDDHDAKQKLARVLDDSGFAAVDLGGLKESARLQDFGGPLSGLHMNLVKRMKS